MSHSLLDVVTACASSDVNIMKEATKVLESMRSQPNYLIDLLKIISITDAAQQHVVLHAAIIFKNDIGKSWDLPAESGGFNDAAKQLVRENILSIHLGLARKPQRQTLEAIYLISLNDFPFVWRTLLSELQTLLVQAAPAGRALVVEVMRQVCERYSSVSHDVSEDQSTLLELRDVVLPALFNASSALNIVSLASDSVNALLQGGLQAEDAKMVCSVIEASVAIQTSILSVDLAAQIEDSLPSCVPLYAAVLKLTESHCAGLAAPRGGFEPGPLDSLQCSILAFYSCLTRKFQKEAEPYLKQMAEASFAAINRVGAAESGDAIVASGVELLSTIAKQTWDPSCDPFLDADAIVPLLVEQVILPCVLLRPCDEELFEERPAEYIVRDLDQGDDETRRRAGLDLVKALMNPRACNPKRQQLVTQCLLGKVQGLMQGADMRSREGAVCIVSGLAAAEESRVLGVTKLNPELPFDEVLKTLVLPVLAAPQNASKTPLLSCACLRFVALYRAVLSPPQRIELASILGQHLSIPHATVRAYAAYALERLLFKLQTEENLNLSQFAALLPLAARAAAEEGGDLPQDPEAMRLLWRTLAFLGAEAQPHIEAVLESLTSIASRLPATAVSMGTSPRYVQFTFEALTVVVGLLAQMTDGPHAAGAVGLLSSKLLPCLLSLLQASECDFASYAIQVLQAILSSFKSAACAGLVEQLGSFLPSLLEPAFFEATRAHSAAVASLLIAFLERADLHALIVPRLPALLQRAKFCLLTRTLEPHGFHLIMGVVRCLPLEAWAQTYMTPIVKELLGRLMGAKQNVDIRARVMLAFATIIAACKGDASVLAAQLEGVKPALAANIFTKMWLPTLNVYQQRPEKRVMTLALLAAAGEPRFFNPAAMPADASLSFVAGLAHLLLITGEDTAVTADWCLNALTDTVTDSSILSAARQFSGLEQVARFSLKEGEVPTGSYEASFKRLVSADAGVNRRDLCPGVGAKEIIGILGGAAAPAVRAVLQRAFAAVNAGEVKADVNQRTCLKNVGVLMGM